MSGDVLQTEFEFTLPNGYVDDEGVRHTDGVMRRATAADEIEPLNDPRVQENGAYLTVILLARVITQLGTLENVTPHVIENLFVSDLEHVQAVYDRVNDRDTDPIIANCPTCGEEFQVGNGSETGFISRVRSNTLLSSVIAKLARAFD